MEQKEILKRQSRLLEEVDILAKSCIQGENQVINTDNNINE
jgi:hypothetical protein